MTYPLNTLLETQLYLASSNCLINSKKLSGCFVFCSVLRSTELFLHWKAAGSLILVLTVHHDARFLALTWRMLFCWNFCQGLKCFWKLPNWQLWRLSSCIYLLDGYNTSSDCSSCPVLFLCHLLQANVEGPLLKRRETAFITSYWKAVTILQCF